MSDKVTKAKAGYMELGKLMRAASYWRFPSSFCHTIMHVVGIGADKQVRRPDALWIITSVANQQTAWNIAIGQNPRHSVRSKWLGAFTDCPIAAIYATSPKPTFSNRLAMAWKRSILIYKFPKSFIRRNRPRSIGASPTAKFPISTSKLYGLCKKLLSANFTGSWYCLRRHLRLLISLRRFDCGDGCASLWSQFTTCELHDKRKNKQG